MRRVEQAPLDAKLVYLFFKTNESILLKLILSMPVNL